MLAIVGKMLLEQAVEIGVNYVVPKATNYMEKNIPKAIDYVSDYAVKKISDYKNHDNQNSEYDNELIDDSMVIFKILEMLNKDSGILNNPNDKFAADFIRKKFLKNNPEYVEIDSDFVERIIQGIRIDVNRRYSLLEELKKHPRIIRQSTSAIWKTACANIGITDEILKTELKIDIDMIKNILELHKSGVKTSEIFKQIFVFNEEGFFFAFEFEIRQFIKVLNNIQEENF